MNAKLQQLFDQAENHRIALLDSLKSYSDESLQCQPKPEAWSVIQVLQHLILAEAGTLGYMKKKVLGIDTIPHTGLGTELKVWLLHLYTDVIPNKINAPASIAHPPGDVSLIKTAEKWNEVRKAIFDFMEAIPEKDLTKALFKHPLAGRINVYHTAAFLDWHVSRHEKQIRRGLR